MNFKHTQGKQAEAHIAGFGLRSPHIQNVIETQPQAGFLEIHSENYFAKGGATKRALDEIAKNYALSFHGVALSLGSAEEPSKEHLARLKELVDRYNPALVSEHIAWNITDGVYLNDLLPVPYTEEAAQILIRNVRIMQETLERQILIENPSAYLSYNLPEMMPEGDFIKEIINETNCGLLLDVNNVFVSTQNMGTDPYAHLDAMPFDKVGEIHLAGHSIKTTDHGELRIDTHSKAVCKEVWDLYKYTIARTGQVPTLIEWDDEIPELDVLLAEANKATTILQAHGETKGADDAA